MIKRKSNMGDENKVIIPDERKNKFWIYYLKIADMAVEAAPDLLDEFNSATDVLEKKYIIANIPKKYYNFTLDSIKDNLLVRSQNDESFKKIKNYILDLDEFVKDGSGLYISGSTGIAKTTMSTIILKEAINLYYRCYFINVRNMVKMIKDSWYNRDLKRYFSYIVKNSDILVIDEFGKMDKTFEAEIQEIYNVFSNRDYANLITIITTNYSMENAKEIFGDSLYSKFKERLIPVHFVGEDFRDTLADKNKKRLEG
jgi:DNA replication protein DnaC